MRENETERTATCKWQACCSLAKVNILPASAGVVLNVSGLVGPMLVLMLARNRVYPDILYILQKSGMTLFHTYYKPYGTHTHSKPRQQNQKKMFLFHPSLNKVCFPQISSLALKISKEKQQQNSSIAIVYLRKWRQRNWKHSCSPLI